MSRPVLVRNGYEVTLFLVAIVAAVLVGILSNQLPTVVLVTIAAAGLRMVLSIRKSGHEGKVSMSNRRRDLLAATSAGFRLVTALEVLPSGPKFSAFKAGLRVGQIDNLDGRDFPWNQPDAVDDLLFRLRHRSGLLRLWTERASESVAAFGAEISTHFFHLSDRDRACVVALQEAGLRATQTGQSVQKMVDELQVKRDSLDPQLVISMEAELSEAFRDFGAGLHAVDEAFHDLSYQLARDHQGHAESSAKATWRSGVRSHTQSVFDKFPQHVVNLLHRVGPRLAKSRRWWQPWGSRPGPRA